MAENDSAPSVAAPSGEPLNPTTSEKVERAPSQKTSEKTPSTKTKDASAPTEDAAAGTVEANPSASTGEESTGTGERKKSLEEIKAAARAYALSSTTSKKRVPVWQQALKKGKAKRKENNLLPPQVPYPPSAHYPYSHYPPPPYQQHHYPHHPSYYPHHTTSPPPPPPPPPPGSHPTRYPASHHPPYPYPPYPPPPYPHQHHRPPYGAPSAASKTAPKPTDAKAASAAAPAAESTTHVPAPVATTAMPPNSKKEDASVLPPIAGAEPRQLTWTAERLLLDENLNDYDKLVKGLNILEMNDILQLFQDDDEDEYNLLEEDEDIGEEDDEEEEEEEGDRAGATKAQGQNEGAATAASVTATAESQKEKGDENKQDQTDVKSSLSINDSIGSGGDAEDLLNAELAQELGWLEEEDIEAAVASLLDPNTKHEDATSSSDNGLESLGPNKSLDSDVNANRDKTSESEQQTPGGSVASSSATMRTPATTSVPFKQKTVVTAKQKNDLASLLKNHYQLLVQQAVLTVRAAHYHKYHRSRTDRTDFLAGGETGDDLVEILDAAVGMLQDVGQNRKDAIRHSLQFDSWKGQHRQYASEKPGVLPSNTEERTASSPDTGNPSKRALFDESVAVAPTPASERRLTRAQFHRTLIEQSKKEQSVKTVFDIKGLLKLDETFALIDRSVSVRPDEDAQTQLLEIESNKEACEYVLDATQQPYDKALIPGCRDLSESFCDAREFLGPKFKPPSDEKQQSIFKRHRNLFTAGEDNLVLRGVNLYGEKQWMLIADRFLPERSTNIISQRYSKLCVMLYKANGITVDAEGRLDKPPKLESIDDIDEKAMSKLRPVQPPAVLNVHRWSLEEDLTLLKAVPITGHMWAELGARLIPHRDRGHLRKRYQVLERRVKSTVERSNKRDYLKQLEESAGRPPKPLPDPAKKQTISHFPMESRHTLSEDRPYPSPARSAATGKMLPSPQHSSRGSAETTRAGSAVAQSPHRSQPTPSSSVPPPPPYSPYHAPPPPYGYPYPSPYMSPPHTHHHYPPHPGYSPYGHLPPYFDPYMDESSRVAFEKLAQDGPDHKAPETGWSNMSNQMKDLTKTENMVASAMANDLARSPSKQGSGKSNVDSTHAVKTDNTEGSNDSPSIETPEVGNTPSKESGKDPNRDPSKAAIFSTDGTQIGLSPAFQRSPAAKHGWPKDAAGSPGIGNMSMSSFPATSNIGYSPMGTASPADALTPPTNSMDSAAMDHLRSGQSGKRKPLFQDPPLAENDLETEAISGLELMANSPGIPPSAGSDLSKKERDSQSKGARSSLFAKVVGDKNDDRKKRKLVF